MCVYVLWWKFHDGSSCGVERVYWDQARGQADTELLNREATSKVWTLEPMAVLGAPRP